LVGPNAGRGLFGRHEPIASHFCVSHGFGCVLALTPGHPVLSTLGRLHESAFAQVHLGAADHQLLHEESIAKAEDGADVVVLGDAIQHDGNRAAR
jgi:hypothetical protein